MQMKESSINHLMVNWTYLEKCYCLQICWQRNLEGLSLISIQPVLLAHLCYRTSILSVPTMSECTVADWHIELLIICYMCYRCCINEQCSFTISWHWGPWGGRLRPRSVYKLPFFPWQTVKLPLTAESRSSLHSQFFRCSCFAVPHSFTQASSGYNEKWCDAFFLFYAWHLGKAIWFVDSKLEKGWGTRNKASWNQPRKTFKFGSSIIPANKMVNCWSFCCTDAS